MIESDTTFRMAGNSGGHHHPTSHDFRLLTTEPSQQTEELLGDLQSLSWLTTVDVPRLQEMATGRLAFNTGAQSSMLEQQLDQRSSMNTVLGHDDTMIPPHSNMHNSYTGLNIQNGNMTGYPGYQSPPAHYYHSHQQLFSPAQTLQQCSPTSLYSSPSYSDQNLYEQHHTITSYRTQDQDQDLLQTKAFPKPIYSYSCLIAMALKNSQTGSLPVSEIYSFMKEHFPYFKSAPDGWKNSVRHNLSLNKSFEKVENKQGSSSRKGCLWALNPAKIDKMEEEMQKWKRKDLTSIRNSMANPDELDKLITDRPEGCHRKCYDPSMTCVPCSHVLGRTPPLHAVSDFYHNPLIQQPPCRPPHSLYNLYPDVTAEVDTLDPSIMEFAGLWEEMREEGFNLETLGNFNHSPLCLSDCDMTGPSLTTTPAEGLPLVDLQVGGLYTTYTTLDTATGVPSQYITTQGGGQAIALL